METVTYHRLLWNIKKIYQSDLLSLNPKINGRSQIVGWLVLIKEIFQAFSYGFTIAQDETPTFAQVHIESLKKPRSKE